MPSAVVGLLLGAGVGAWVFNKTMRHTGNNTKNSLIVAGVAGGFAFVAAVIALNAIPK